MIGLQHYLVVSAILFLVGLAVSSPLAAKFAFGGAVLAVMLGAERRLGAITWAPRPMANTPRRRHAP